MIIKNFKKLASTPEREIALEIANAGLEAIKPEKVIKENITLKENILKIKDQKIDLKKIKNLYVLGIGKAAYEAGRAVEKILGNLIKDGIILDIKKGSLKHLKSFKGDHPFPSEKNLKIAKKIVALAKKATKDDLVLCLVSGGASALFSLPHKLSPKKLKSLTKKLLKSGADIYEINTVRKHISQVKGGGLAKFVYPAKLISLIFSDVPGNDLSFIASGPTVKDETTKKDALKILKKYHLPKVKLFETPKDKKYFANVTNILVLSGITAINVMEKKCQELKIPCSIYSYALRGEAKIVGRKILQRLPKKGILLACGETTVTVEGKGKGGRNQELVLGALPYLEKTVFVALASDGLDNNEAAGAIADEDSLKRAIAKKIIWRKYIDNNDSFNFFEKLDDLIITGPTGTNVADLIVIYKE